MALLRFVQTGDWHLGQAYRSVADPDLAERLRRARLDAVGRLLDEAGRLGAAFVIAAGDQFEGDMPDRETVGQMLDQVGAHPAMPVHMIPGNHDPGGPGSIYERAELRSGPPNLHVHDRPIPVPLPEFGATLYPCPCSARYGDDPMAWVPPRGSADGLRIALAHGSLPRFRGSDGRNYPIRDDAPAALDLDYVALGDWHTPNPDPTLHPRGRMYYAGAPEVGGWDEVGAGSILEVALATDAAPVVSAHRLGRFRWVELRPDLLNAADVGRLASDLAGLASTTTVARVRPKGRLSIADRGALERLVTERAASFASLTLDLRDLGVAAGEVDLPRDPLIQEAYRRLIRLAADPADAPPPGLPRDLPPLDPAIVARALDRFRALLP